MEQRVSPRIVPPMRRIAFSRAFRRSLTRIQL